MKIVIDNFSEGAKTYAKFRPVYPENLYNFIYSHVKNFDKTWDCGTGNGQVAVELSKKFNQVFATDISDSQLAEATPKPNIFYSNTRAEKTDFPDNSFDLITVAQAFHWFDEDAFSEEVIRVAKPNALLAVWGYNLLKINPEVDRIIAHFYSDIMGDYWNPERKIVEQSYTNILFPLDEIIAPEFEMKAQWRFDQLIGYLSSWSSVIKYEKLNGLKPIKVIESDLLMAWGDKETHHISFPVFLRLGKINY